jgi:serine/threonine protein kinase
MPLRGEAANVPTYDLRDRLTAGAAIEVQKAWHEVYECDCVQKTVSYVGIGGAVALSEPQVLKNLDHKRVVPIWEAQFDPVHPDAVTFVMPWFPGGSVQRALDDGDQFALMQAVGIVCDALEALAYVHGTGLLHRDIKPGNILLDEDRRHGHLTDFGSAARHTPPPPVAGFTFAYLDPATIAPNAMTVQSDVYAMGLTLYEMLNGPLQLDDIDDAAVVRRLNAQRRPFPESRLVWQPHVPDKLRRAVNKAIRVDPSSRYRTAVEFLAALHDVNCIDWRKVSDGPDGATWEGTWPPHRRQSERRQYRVTTRLLRGGRDAGRYRVDADFAGSDGWRGFGVASTTVDGGDLTALAKFFSTLARRVSQIRAAR